jgi:supervillin
MSTTPQILINNEKTANKSKSSGESISSRVAALKRNGEENWKKRVQNEEKSDVVLRVSSNSNRNRSSSIADRVSLLEDSQILWKNRVEDKDVNQFTVAGKMMQTETPVIKTPEVQRKTPKAVPFRSQTTAQLLESMKTERPVSSPSLLTPSLNSKAQNSDSSAKSLSTKTGVLVSIPKPDDDLTFNSFFSNKSKPKHDNNEVISDKVFDEICAERSDLYEFITLDFPQRKTYTNLIINFQISSKEIRENSK